MKRYLSLLMCVMMIFSMTACSGGDSEQNSEPLDFSADRALVSSEGDGWSWDADTRTLSLYDMKLRTDSTSVILPDGGATIVIDGDNYIMAETQDAQDIYAVQCPGSLTVRGSGTLTVISNNGVGDAVGISAQALSMEARYVSVQANCVGDFGSAYAVSVQSGIRLEGGVFFTAGSAGGNAVGVRAGGSVEMTSDSSAYIVTVGNAGEAVAVSCGDSAWINGEFIVNSDGQTNAAALEVGADAVIDSNAEMTAVLNSDGGRCAAVDGRNGAVSISGKIEAECEAFAETLCILSSTLVLSDADIEVVCSGGDVPFGGVRGICASSSMVIAGGEIDIECVASASDAVGISAQGILAVSGTDIKISSESNGRGYGVTVAGVPGTQAVINRAGLDISASDAAVISDVPLSVTRSVTLEGGAVGAAADGTRVLYSYSADGAFSGIDEFGTPAGACTRVKNIYHAAKPVISPSDIPPRSGLIVGIECETPGAVIHYTTDGSRPDLDSPVYVPGETVITADSQMKIRAYASFDGVSDSDIATARYEYLSGGASAWALGVIGSVGAVLLVVLLVYLNKNRKRFTGED